MYISTVVEGIVKFYSEPIVQSFLKVCLTIDSVIYNLISWLYSVFITIAKARVFTAETVKPFLDRIYLIIGIAALFFAAYTFMTIIVNPENLSKGNSSPAKLIRNIILGILSITFIPTIFNFAYSVQGAALDQNVIGKLFISGTDTLMDDSENNLNQFGVTLFEASYYVKSNSAADAKVVESTKTCYENAHKYAMSYSDVSLYGSCMSGVQDGTIQYNFILAGVIGIIVCYIFFVYCFDLGLRAIKLAFLQIISPLPSLLLMVPGQDKVYKNWLKDTLKTFFEVFLKIFIVIFCVYIIQLLREWFDVNQAQVFPGVSLTVVNFAKIFIFLGVIMFMKKAPKLIEDLFGIKTDPKAFSLKQRFVDSGIATAFDKTVGVAGSMAASYMANRKGAMARLKKDETYLAASDIEKKKMLKKETGVGGALAMGAFLGAKNGRAGIGTAYGTGFDTQFDKANRVSKGEMAFNYARGFLGIQSKYEDLNELNRIETDAADYVDRTQRMYDEANIGKTRRDINSQYDDPIRATDNFEGAYKSTMDYASEHAKKQGGIQRRVPIARAVAADDANSLRKVQTGVNAGKNLFQLRDEAQQIDSTIASHETDIESFRREQSEIEAKRIAAASSQNFGAASALEKEKEAIDSKISAAQAQIAAERTKKAAIQSDINTLSQGEKVDIEYDLVEGLNLSQIEQYQKTLEATLAEKGASSQQIAEAFSRVNTGKNLDGTTFDFADYFSREKGITDIQISGKEKFTGIDAGGTRDVFTFKAAIGSGTRQYVSDNIATDAGLKEHVVTTSAKSQSEHVGIDPAGGVKFDIGNYHSNVNDRGDITDINEFFRYFDDEVKGSTSELKSEKQIKFNTATVSEDVEVHADGKVTKRSTPRKINVIIDWDESSKARSEARQKEREAYTKGLMGMQQAADRSKKNIEKFRAKRK